jgi:hypothetical protein
MKTRRELAMTYFEFVAPKTALNNFKRYIDETPGLLQALERVGYAAGKRYITPKQEEVIVDYLGEP